MASPAPAVAVVGCTGLVGANILSTLLHQRQTTTIHAFNRRPLPTNLTSPEPRFHAIISSDSSTWPTELSHLSPAPSILISALGTTRGAAGSVAAQRAIDFDLNLALAKAAQQAGTKVYVLISVHGADSGSRVPYTRMKGELDEAVQTLGFQKVVLLKPGLIIGTRRKEDSRPPEAVLRYIAKGLRAIAGESATDWWAQDAQVIARAAVEAGIKCLEGGEGVPEGKTWVLGMKDIVRLAKEAEAR